MKILLLGKNGQIGTELNSILKDISSFKIKSLSRKDCNLENFTELHTQVSLYKPDVIINAAAYTNVDDAETDNKICEILNSDLPLQLANFCKEKNIVLIHYSTDYVFDGNKKEAYEEEDSVNPINFYGKSKLQGEINIREVLSDHIIIRTSWVYSPYGRNFLKTIVKLAAIKKDISIIDDQYGVPTSAQFIAQKTLLILKEIKNNYSPHIFGTYHITPNGQTNWFNFSQKIIEHLVDLKFKILCNLDDIKPIKTHEYNSKAIRPKNSVLKNNKYRLVFDDETEEWERYIKPVILELLRNIDND